MPWTSELDATAAPRPSARPIGRAMLRGASLSCPNCGKGRLFAQFTKVMPQCAICGEDFSPQRADDAPPYVVIFIVGHIIVASALALEKTLHPPLWLHFSLWLPLTIVFALLLLPPVKGAIVGLQWANRMHGFGSKSEATT